jgi:transposase InsO family protein
MPRRSGRPEEADEGIAETRVRYGYRRIYVLLRREGWGVNAKRIYRLYKEMGLQLRHKPPKRRVKAKLKEGRCAASSSNEVWAEPQRLQRCEASMDSGGGHGLCP